ncbi:MAG: hypothetical protein ACE5LU_27720 [Anaerolineae bacterium]
MVVFLGREPLDPQSQMYADLEAYVMSLSASPEAIQQNEQSFFEALQGAKEKGRQK